MSSTISSLLIASLSPAFREALLSRLRPVPLPAGAVVYEPYVTPKYAHFFTSGLASIVSVMADGATTEVGTWGREGLAESFHLLGNAGVPSRCFMQVGGTALRMPFKELQEEFLECAEFRDCVLQCVQSQCAIMGQLAACNRLHESEARLARWLLTARDEIQSDTLFITQELLASMLGARRTTITAAAGVLKDRRLVKYSRGNLQIVDPAGLEKAACECFRLVRHMRQNFYCGRPMAGARQGRTTSRPADGRDSTDGVLRTQSNSGARRGFLED